MSYDAERRLVHRTLPTEQPQPENPESGSVATEAERMGREFLRMASRLSQMVRAFFSRQMGPHAPRFHAAYNGMRTRMGEHQRETMRTIAGVDVLRRLFADLFDREYPNEDQAPQDAAPREPTPGVPEALPTPGTDVVPTPTPIPIPTPRPPLEGTPLPRPPETVTELPKPTIPDPLKLNEVAVIPLDTDTKLEVSWGGKTFTVTRGEVLAATEGPAPIPFTVAVDAGKLALTPTAVGAFTFRTVKGAAKSPEVVRSINGMSVPARLELNKPATITLSPADKPLSISFPKQPDINILAADGTTNRDWFTAQRVGGVITFTPKQAGKFTFTQDKMTVERTVEAPAEKKLTVPAELKIGTAFAVEVNPDDELTIEYTLPDRPGKTFAMKVLKSGAYTMTPDAAPLLFDRSVSRDTTTGTVTLKPARFGAATFKVDTKTERRTIAFDAAMLEGGEYRVDNDYDRSLFAQLTLARRVSDKLQAATGYLNNYFNVKFNTDGTVEELGFRKKDEGAWLAGLPLQVTALFTPLRGRFITKNTLKKLRTDVEKAMNDHYDEEPTAAKIVALEKSPVGEILTLTVTPATADVTVKIGGEVITIDIAGNASGGTNIEYVTRTDAGAITFRPKVAGDMEVSVGAAKKTIKIEEAPEARPEATIEVPRRTKVGEPMVVNITPKDAVLTVVLDGETVTINTKGEMSRGTKIKDVRRTSGLITFTPTVVGDMDVSVPGAAKKTVKIEEADPEKPKKKLELSFGSLFKSFVGQSTQFTVEPPDESVVLTIRDATCTVDKDGNVTGDGSNVTVRRNRGKLFVASNVVGNLKLTFADNSGELVVFFAEVPAPDAPTVPDLAVGKPAQIGLAEGGTLKVTVQGKDYVITPGNPPVVDPNTDLPFSVAANDDKSITFTPTTAKEYSFVAVRAGKNSRVVKKEAKEEATDAKLEVPLTLKVGVESTITINPASKLQLSYEVGDPKKTYSATVTSLGVRSLEIEEMPDAFDVKKGDEDGALKFTPKMPGVFTFTAGTLTQTRTVAEAVTGKAKLLEATQKLVDGTGFSTSEFDVTNTTCDIWTNPDWLKSRGLSPAAFIALKPKLQYLILTLDNKQRVTGVKVKMQGDEAIAPPVKELLDTWVGKTPTNKSLKEFTPKLVEALNKAYTSPEAEAQGKLLETTQKLVNGTGFSTTEYDVTNTTCDIWTNVISLTPYGLSFAARIALKLKLSSLILTLDDKQKVTGVKVKMDRDEAIAPPVKELLDTWVGKTPTNKSLKEFTPKLVEALNKAYTSPEAEAQGKLLETTQKLVNGTGFSTTEYDVTNTTCDIWTNSDWLKPRGLSPAALIALKSKLQYLILTLDDKQKVTGVKVKMHRDEAIALPVKALLDDWVGKTPTTDSLKAFTPKLVEALNAAYGK